MIKEARLLCLGQWVASQGAMRLGEAVCCVSEAATRMKREVPHVNPALRQPPPRGQAQTTSACASVSYSDNDIK